MPLSEVTEVIKEERESDLTVTANMAKLENWLTPSAMLVLLTRTILGKVGGKTDWDCVHKRVERKELNQYIGNYFEDIGVKHFSKIWRVAEGERAIYGESLFFYFFSLRREKNSLFKILICMITIEGEMLVT